MRLLRPVLVWSCLAAACASPTRPTTTTSAPPEVVAQPPTQPAPVTPTPPVVTPPVAAPPTLARTAILAFGDSMTEGQSAAFRTLELVGVTSYPSYLREMLAARYTAQSVSVSNAGVSGEWAQDGMFRLPFVLDRATPPPDVLLLLEGVNDIGTLGPSGISRAEAAIEAMARTGRERGLRVFIATLPPQRPGGARADAADLVPELNRRIRIIARGEGAALVDLEAAFGRDDTLLSADGLHPSVAGYRAMASAFFAAITADLERAPATTTAATH